MLGDFGISTFPLMRKAGLSFVSAHGTHLAIPSQPTSDPHGSKHTLLVARLPAPDPDSTFSWDLHVTSSCHRIKIYSVNTSRPETARRLKMLEEHGADITNLSQPFELALESEEEYEQAYHQHPREPLS